MQKLKSKAITSIFVNSFPQKHIIRLLKAKCQKYIFYFVDINIDRWTITIMNELIGLYVGRMPRRCDFRHPNLEVVISHLNAIIVVIPYELIGVDIINNHFHTISHNYITSIKVLFIFLVNLGILLEKRRNFISSEKLIFKDKALHHIAIEY